MFGKRIFFLLSILLTFVVIQDATFQKYEIDNALHNIEKRNFYYYVDKIRDYRKLKHEQKVMQELEQQAKNRIQMRDWYLWQAFKRLTQKYVN